MPQVAMQGIGLNYGSDLKADDWKPWMDADLVIVNGMLGNRVQAVVNAEPSVAVAPDASNAGKAWIVGTSPSGAWATGKANHLAFRNGETATWIFIAPHAAFGPILNLATGEFMVYRQGAWVTAFTDGGDPFPSQGFEVEDFTATPPTPASPADDGKCWAIATGATGVWAGHDGKMAIWYVPPGGSTGAWRIVTPEKGWRVISTDVPFGDELSAYGGSPTYRELLINDGTPAWKVDGVMRKSSGPLFGVDASVATPGVPYIRVLTEEEALAPTVLVALAASGTLMTLRYPASMSRFAPTSVQVSAIYCDPDIVIGIDWGDGTETPGAIGTTGDPGVGGPAGSPVCYIRSGVFDEMLTLTPALGMTSTSVLQSVNAMNRGDSRAPLQITFTAGNYDLGIPADVITGLLDNNSGDLGRLLYSDEATANTVTILANPGYLTPSDAVVRYTFAQKGVGVTTIVLDNTVTGTNNANDILIAIAPAAMAQGESRVLRHQPNGGTGGAGDAWIITYS